MKINKSIKNVSGIYMLINEYNGKIYIGQAKNLYSRIYSHQYKKSKHRSLIGDAIRKYGWENFSYEILEEVSVEYLNECETIWIKHFESYKREVGYNLLPTGFSWRGFNHTVETKVKMSEQKSGKYCGSNNPMFGRKHSKETLEELSELAKTRMKGSGNPMFGRRHSEEAKAKMSKVAKSSEKKKDHIESLRKRVNQIDITTGEIIKTWESISDAANGVSGNMSHISEICRGKSSRRCCKGFSWSYADK